LKKHYVTQIVMHRLQVDTKCTHHNIDTATPGKKARARGVGSANIRGLTALADVEAPPLPLKLPFPLLDWLLWQMETIIRKAEEFICTKKKNEFSMAVSYDK
jgi:hypothetical protein